MKNAELHCHSHYSDGMSSPAELVKKAKQKKIKYLALTDHNSVKGVKEAIKAGKKYGINIIPAVEIRCHECEVLGYFVDIKNRELNKQLALNRKQVEDIVKDWCRKLKKAGVPVDFTEIHNKFPKAKGNINDFYVLYLMHLKGWGTINQVRIKLRRLMKKHNFKFSRIKEMPAVKAIRLIRKAGGVPVLAHPWLGGMEILKKLVRAGLKGIEFSNGDNAPFRPAIYTRKIKAAAKRYKLIITTGSDYHGDKLAKMMTQGNHYIGSRLCDKKVVEQLARFAGIYAFIY
jgi:hypothetical protein